ncbi:alpha/beta hydrolase family protein [Photorhabdus tasmaniensis]|uniref:Alpha/beta hydrolase n=1 Tax=Photorhabdus tasmaniensis TaxID=1004159 RepID=A0ABX0GF48_9GAMM|nr:alpha/beta hydrolase [Photorhabdus tasmaniensis]NHB87722.1 alpha/beta hydrolase [Photorhabdus tasmaniensis]
MNNKNKPNRISAALFSTCGYFMPRLFFLNSQYAPQVHWGDVVEALSHFQEENLDLSSEEFWHEWMINWSKVGDNYISIANSAKNEVSYVRALKSAAACYHWAEFMYFSDKSRKIQLREYIRSCFLSGIKYSDLLVEHQYIIVDKFHMPFFLIFPKGYKEEENNPLPCVILSNGLDSMTEIEILSLAELFLEKGMAVAIFDGPGQGVNLGKSPLAIDMELYVTSILKLLEDDARINSGLLCFLGISFGGYFALRLAQKIGDKFCCIVNLSGGPEIADFDKLPRRLKADFQFAFMQDNHMQSLFDEIKLDLSLTCKTKVFTVHGALDDIFSIDKVRELDHLWGDDHKLLCYESEAHVCLNKINEYMIQVLDWVNEQFRLNGGKKN